MIFVTVGTHEQQFNRLIIEIDNLKEQRIKEDVFIQTGFSTYKPKFCKYKDFLSKEEMDYFFKKSNIVITHGGPSTFMSLINKGKKIVVVPRKKKFGEHINDHQVDFVKKINLSGYPIVPVYDIEELYYLLENKNATIGQYRSNNAEFCKKLGEEIRKVCDDS